MSKYLFKPCSKPLSSVNLHEAMQQEGEKFQNYYLWLEQAMPVAFFEEVSQENLLLIVHSLMGFDLQDYFSTINLKSAAIALCLDSSDADLRILRHFVDYGIKNYQVYVSKKPAPFPGVNAPLRIATIDFTEAVEISEKTFSEENKILLRDQLREKAPEITEEKFDDLLNKMNTRFLMSLSVDQLVLAFDMLYRAQTRDNCQYEVRYEEEWQKKKNCLNVCYPCLA